MSERPTPETDAFQNERHTMNAYRKVLAFARQLERQRDEARDLARELCDALERTPGLLVDDERPTHSITIELA